MHSICSPLITYKQLRELRQNRKILSNEHLIKYKFEENYTLLSV